MRAPTRNLALVLLAVVAGACSDPTGANNTRRRMAAPGADLLDGARPPFVVTTTADAVDALPGDGVCATALGACSLRAAVQEANALTGPDQITLPAGRYEITLTSGAAGQTGAEAGDLDITDPLVIVGAGVNETTIACGAGTNACLAPNGGIFRFASPGIAVSGVTLVGAGASLISAGAIGVLVEPEGEALLRDVVIREFGSGIIGGGISNRGTLWLDRSTIAANIARDGGGGVYNTGTATITNSTLRDNVGWLTGGAITNGGTLTLVNSTLSGNSVVPRAAQAGGAGALYNTGEATLNSVTITANSGGLFSGTGGIFNAESGVVELANTILAGNTTGAGEPSDCQGTLTSLGYNLLGSLAGCTVIGMLQGTLIGVDPLLGPLAPNGGPTETHALLPGSPAIDAGHPSRGGHGRRACPATDQRGFPRVDRCDIGAYEVQ